MKIDIQEWNGSDAMTCARTLAQKPYSLFFDSNCPDHPLNQWSFICFDPIETIEVKNGIITHNNQDLGKHNFFDFLQSRLDKYNFENDSDIPFTGGGAGYFGYDLGRQLETLPDDTIDDIKAPDACIGIYNNILAFDHHKNKAWFIGNTPPDINKASPQTTNNENIKWASDKTCLLYTSPSPRDS